MTFVYHHLAPDELGTCSERHCRDPAIAVQYVPMSRRQPRPDHIQEWTHRQYLCAYHLEMRVTKSAPNPA